MQLPSRRPLVCSNRNLAFGKLLTNPSGLTKIGPNGNGNINFRTVPKALILLFRMSCGEGWNAVMSDFEINEPFCVKGDSFLESDCGSEGYARALFVSWNIVSMYIFVSLVSIYLQHHGCSITNKGYLVCLSHFREFQLCVPTVWQPVCSFQG